MKFGRPDYDAIQPWPTHRPHLVRDPDLDRIVAVQGVHDQGVDEAIDRGDLAPIIPDDEPVFLLRAKDMAGPSTVRAYASAAQLAGADPELIRSALDQADAMEAYARSHYAGGITPTPPDGVPEYPPKGATTDPGRAT